MAPTNLPDGFLDVWSISTNDIAILKLAKQQQDQMAQQQSELQAPSGAISNTPVSGDTSGSSNFQLDEQDRIDIRNGRLPDIIRVGAQDDNIDEDKLLAFLNNVQRDLRQERNVSYLVNNDDGRLFWSMVDKALTDAIVEPQVWGKDPFNRSPWEIFQDHLKGSLENLGAEL